ncbi:MAG: hypothetical protein ACXWNW_09095 [Isosphaeraceae bacterium]
MTSSKIRTRKSTTLRSACRSDIRLWDQPPPDVASPDHAWFDVGPDRHHVAIIPLERRPEAVAMMPEWRVQRGPLWYLCTRVDVGGADGAPT